MIRLLLGASLLLGLTTAAPALAEAPCRAEIEPPAPAAYAGNTGAGYQVFAANPRAEVVPINIKHRGEACDYALTITGPAEAGFGLARSAGETLRFALSEFPDGRPLVRPISAPGGVAVRGRAPASARTRFRPLELYLSAPDGQVAAPGLYQTDLRLRLYLDTGSGWAFAHEVSLSAALPVAASIDLGFAAGGAGASSQDLTLDIDASGGRASTMLHARSNTRFSARVETENDFTLKRTDGLSGAALDYALSLGGRQADGGGLDFNRPAGEESEIPVIVQVDAQPSTPPAGVYRDTVRIIVTAE
ncbi:MAG: hypothetical protein ACFE0P_09345 [Oceanicaulis sp.]